MSAAVAMALALATGCIPQTNPWLPVTYNVSAAVPNLLNPNRAPAGANDFNCKPSAAHPRPVVLVNGTFFTMGVNWATLSPLLKNEGYCVFAFNYGSNWVSDLTNGNVMGLDSVAVSAGQLAAFVDKVLSATHVSQVDLVGHSQGGMMPNYYLKFLDGAPKVHALVALAPDNHGTTLLGLVTLGQAISVAFPVLLPFVNTVIATGAPSLVDQQSGSEFMALMATKPDTVPGVEYTVISSTLDGIVTPYTSQFLNGPNVSNLVVQDQCNQDFAEHIALAFDHIALRDVLNALDPAHAKAPACSLVLPGIGG